MPARGDCEFDVMVIGAGHAGCEAALAAARLGACTLLLTPSLDAIAAMPCNCSIGGPAKAHLVREIDALGGEMARNVDRTFTHIRLLNASRGPAVQALRAQADKALYRAAMKETLERQPSLQLRQDMAVDILADGGAVQGVVGLTGLTYRARAVVVATGTFLNGVMHIGETRIAGGRSGEGPATHLSDALQRLGFDLRRFKTGTVPRVLLGSLNLGDLGVQPSDARPLRFAYEQVPRPPLPLLPCYTTATNSVTHDLLRAHAHRSALWSGRIEGIGPRYCPSIEAKLMRFPERDSHLVFLEQEGWSTQEVYVQGISNSMPAEVQWDMLRTLPGLRECVMTRPGYAVEYDCIDARALDAHLHYPAVSGLFLAGQVNGTSGYEEAAAQGLIAGINAARYACGQEFVRLARTDGYLGVLVDDLTTRGSEEPYRMLTSRAEFRLLFGQDTAWHRLLPLAVQIGLAPPACLSRLQAEAEAIAVSEQQPNSIPGHGLLRRTRLSYVADRHAELNRLYAPYVQREHTRVRRLRHLQRLRIPRDFRFDALPLRREARERLTRTRPDTLADLAETPGITPADVATVHAALGCLKRHEEEALQREEDRGACFT